MLKILILLLFICLFTLAQGIAYIKLGESPYTLAVSHMKDFKSSSGFISFLAKKSIMLKRYGADMYLADGITVERFYLYKALVSLMCASFASFITRTLLELDAWLLISLLASVAGFFLLDIYIRSKNKAANDQMAEDIVEMSRFVLYGKNGGQYITDALRGAINVVENIRFKRALIKLKANLDSGKGIDEALAELEASFSNAEIVAFCTVVKSLQSTGQIEEALRTLEANIEREQVSVNKRRCVILENQTYFYIMLIAMDILAVILYCIVEKLMQLQVAF